MEKGYELEDVLVNGKSVGKVTHLTGLKTGDKVQVLVKEAKSEKEILLEKMEGIQLVARSSSSRVKGKRAIKITWYDRNGEDITELFDGFEVYRSEQRFKGYGTKPYFETTRAVYWNTKELKPGETYYYKVIGYVIIDGKKYYSEQSLKAWRTF